MIGIIGFNSLSIMQYLYKYTDILDSLHTPYKVVYWDRSKNGEDAPFGERAIVFRAPTVTALPFRKKIIAFLRYSCFLRRVLRREKFDRLILLTSQTAVTLSARAFRQYRGRYIFDYRDITRENIPFYKKKIVRLINESAFTAISSPGFKEVLEGCDEKKLLLSHNIRRPELPVAQPRAIKHEGQIRLVFWGIIRQLDYRKRLCRLFGRDSRFRVVMHGGGLNQELEEYCKTEGLDIAFTGLYVPSQVPDFAAETDLLINLYENDREMRLAIPVKLMDGMRFCLPALVTKGSFAAEYLSPYGVALDIDIDRADEADRVYKWYSALDMNAVKNGYERLADAIRRDEAAFQQATRAFAQKE